MGNLKLKRTSHIARLGRVYPYRIRRHAAWGAWRRYIEARDKRLYFAHIVRHGTYKQRFG
jgi:hypothetical protein